MKDRLSKKGLSMIRLKKREKLLKIKMFYNPIIIWKTSRFDCLIISIANYLSHYFLTIIKYIVSLKCFKFSRSKSTVYFSSSGKVSACKFPLSSSIHLALLGNPNYAIIKKEDVDEVSFLAGRNLLIVRNNIFLNT